MDDEKKAHQHAAAEYLILTAQKCDAFPSQHPHWRHRALRRPDAHDPSRNPSRIPSLTGRRVTVLVAQLGEAGEAGRPLLVAPAPPSQSANASVAAEIVVAMAAERARPCDQCGREGRADASTPTSYEEVGAEID